MLFRSTSSISLSLPHSFHTTSISGRFDPLCYDRASWTILFFSSIPLPSFPPYCTRNTLPSLLVTVLSWTYSPIPRLGQDALRTVHPPPPLSITCLTLTLTVLPTCASVPADVHPLCPSYVHLSSWLPYVSLHLLCTLPDPLTCVIPCPLYMF